MNENGILESQESVPVEKCLSIKKEMYVTDFDFDQLFWFDYVTELNIFYLGFFPLLLYMNKVKKRGRDC